MFIKSFGEKIVRGIIGDPTAFGFYSGFDGAQVNAIAVQPDGKILVSGQFSSYNGTPVEQIVRINSDYTLDQSFSPTGGGIYFNGNDGSQKIGFADRIYVFSDGRIALMYPSQTYIQPTNIGGFSKSNRHPGFVILDSNGALDPTHATFKDTINDMSINTTVVLASAFRDDNLVLRFFSGYLVPHLNPDGTIKRIYNSLSPYSTVPANIKDLAIDSNNKVWAVGQGLNATDPITGNNYSNRGGIWTWDSNGDRDLTTFKGTFFINNSRPGYPIQIEIDSNDNMWVGSTNNYYYPDHFNGDKTTSVAGFAWKLDQTGNVLTNLNLNNYYGNGNIFTSGFKLFDNDYLVMIGNGGPSHIHDGAFHYHNMLVVNPDGSFNTNFASTTNTASDDDKTFGPSPNLRTIAQIDSDSFAVGGSFTKYDGTNINNFIVFNVDGSVEVP